MKQARVKQEEDPAESSETGKSSKAGKAPRVAALHVLEKSSHIQRDEASDEQPHQLGPQATAQSEGKEERQRGRSENRIMQLIGQSVGETGWDRPAVCIGRALGVHWACIGRALGVALDLNQRERA